VWTRGVGTANPREEEEKKDKRKKKGGKRHFVEL
jgi:hypothetical protein